MARLFFKETFQKQQGWQLLFGDDAGDAGIINGIIISPFPCDSTLNISNLKKMYNLYDKLLPQSFLNNFIDFKMYFSNHLSFLKKYNILHLSTSCKDILATTTVSQQPSRKEYLDATTSLIEAVFKCHDDNFSGINKRVLSVLVYGGELTMNHIEELRHLKEESIENVALYTVDSFGCGGGGGGGDDDDDDMELTNLNDFISILSFIGGIICR
jgi:hypothetical protein